MTLLLKAYLDRKDIMVVSSRTQVRDACVMIITASDYRQCGHDCMSFEQYSKEMGRCVDDGRHIVYINGAAARDSFLAGNVLCMCWQYAI